MGPKGGVTTDVAVICNVNGAWRHKSSDSRSRAVGEAQGVFMFMASMCWLHAQRAGGNIGKVLRIDKSMIQIFHALLEFQKFFLSSNVKL